MNGKNWSASRKNMISSDSLQTYLAIKYKYSAYHGINCVKHQWYDDNGLKYVIQYSIERSTYEVYGFSKLGRVDKLGICKTLDDALEKINEAAINDGVLSND